MKVTLQVPENLSEITLGQYQKFEKLNTEENQNSSFLLQKMVQIFCNIDLKDVAKIRYSDVQAIVQDLNAVFDTKPLLKNKVVLNGVKYGFIPNLDDMTLGEYIDLDTNIVDWQTMHRAMAVMFRPITFEKRDQYQIGKYEGVKDDNVFKDMPLDVSLGAQSFFLSLGQELLNNTMKFLELEQEQNLHLQQILIENGDSIKVSMDLIKGILPSLIRLPD